MNYVLNFKVPTGRNVIAQGETLWNKNKYYERAESPKCFLFQSSLLKWNADDADFTDKN